ncbi:hypothetical protein [Anaerosphaera multitolerans]|uniref:hypothetical protein n=1 Tax=Anaerosphaera multitolerans TaxID=2487351 RepID=UPI000FDAB4BE|nr:hypothetical protein [Anaerosphaera multitolerans]
MRKILMLAIVSVMIFSMNANVFAAEEYSTPAEIVADLTGREVVDVISERFESQKTYGTIAEEAGVFEEYQKLVFQIKKDTIEQRVKDGKLSRNEADDFIKAIEDNLKTCDGTGKNFLGQDYGIGFGSKGNGRGNFGAEQGQGVGRGANSKGQGGLGLGGGICQR